MRILMDCGNFLFRFLKVLFKSDVAVAYMCITFVIGLFLVFDRLMKGHYR